MGFKTFKPFKLLKTFGTIGTIGTSVKYQQRHSMLLNTKWCVLFALLRSGSARSQEKIRVGLR